MARILSSPWVIIRGSIGGTTYLANQFHQIVARARTAPVQPNTNNQSLARSALVTADAGWGDLTPAVRNLWDQYASGTPFSGPLGPYTVPGRQMFMAGRSLGIYIVLRGLALPVPSAAGPGVLDGFLALRNVKTTSPVSPGTTGISLTCQADPSDDTCPMVEISPGFPVTRNRYKGPWFTPSSLATVMPVNTSTFFEFSGLVTGMAYFTRIKAVASDAPERISATFITRHIAEDVP